MYGKEERSLDWLVESGLESASYWETLTEDKVRCRLCPRQCVVRPSNFGFCRARFNQAGALKTAIWGKLLTPSVEPIETEAVFHYWPGERILSVGNLGCNLSCKFCQNWESSDLLNLNPAHVKYHTPQEIVHLAKSLGVRVLSFTYNDPVIWFEFVLETAKLARREGLKTLFKSAGFISPQAARRLTHVIDIFSISIKSISPKTFKVMSQGILQPVLDATKIFFQSGRHLEVSNLVVPGLTDRIDDVRTLTRWVRSELSDEVPVHFVRFHPCYEYTHVPRTSVAFLEQAREQALAGGLKYVYIGNTFERGHANSHCRACGNLVVERFGLYTKICGATDDARCLRCGAELPYKLALREKGEDLQAGAHVPADKHALWAWSNEDTRNLHLQIENRSSTQATVVCEHLGRSNDVIDCEIMDIPGGGVLRVAVGQAVENEAAVRIRHTAAVTCEITELLDRAHFPLDEIA